MATTQIAKMSSAPDDEIVSAPNGATGIETRVVRVRVLHDFVIKTTFADGFRRGFDMWPELEGVTEQFAALRDRSFFARGAFDSDLGTIAWPNGFDLSPEFLRWGPDPCVSA